MMTSKNKAIIVASETPIDFSFYLKHNYFIVAVERGALTLMKQKIPIDLAIGDFDKVTASELKSIQHYATHTIVASRQKDYLDGELAILALKEKGFNNIKFVAEPNQRYDKSMSIFSLIWHYDITFFNQSTLIFKIKSGTTRLRYSDYKTARYISFLANQPSLVTINNFKYNVRDMRLLPFDNRAISNEFIPKVDGEIKTNHSLVAVLSY